MLFLYSQHIIFLYQVFFPDVERAEWLNRVSVSCKHKTLLLIFTLSDDHAVDVIILSRFTPTAKLKAISIILKTTPSCVC